MSLCADMECVAAVAGAGCTPDTQPCTGDKGRDDTPTLKKEPESELEQEVEQEVDTEEDRTTDSDVKEKDSDKPEEEVTRPREHRVQERETVNSIAALYDVTPSELCQLNRLGMSRMVFPGQVLPLLLLSSLLSAPPPLQYGLSHVPNFSRCPRHLEINSPGVFTSELKALFYPIFVCILLTTQFLEVCG